MTDSSKRPTPNGPRHNGPPRDSPPLDRSAADHRPAWQRDLESDGEGPIPIAPGFDEPKRPPTEPTVGGCPSCARSMPADSVICIHCGFDRRKGYRRGNGVGSSPGSSGSLECPSCGYSLVGLKHDRCPECGQRDVGPNSRVRRQQQAKRAEAMELGGPIGVLVGSWVLSGLLLTASGNSTSAVGMLISFPILIIGGFAGYSCVAMLLTGWPFTLGITLLRVGAVVSFLAAISLLFRMVGVPFILRIPISLGISCAVITWLLDVELQDAWPTAMAISAGMFVVGMLVMAAGW